MSWEYRAECGQGAEKGAVGGCGGEGGRGMVDLWHAGQRHECICEAQALSYPALSCLALPCPALPCSALPCPALPRPGPPCPSPSHPALPCPALPSPVQSSPSLPCTYNQKGLVCGDGLAELAGGAAEPSGQSGSATHLWCCHEKKSTPTPPFSVDITASPARLQVAALQTNKQSNSSVATPFLLCYGQSWVPLLLLL